MTSKAGASECYVYIMLPGATEFVTAGRFVLEPDSNGVPVGRFVYGRSYLARANAVPIDPLELKLANTTYRTTALKGVFGALRDAGPDYWGRRVIEKKAGIDNDYPTLFNNIQLGSGLDQVHISTGRLREHRHLGH